VGKRNDPEGLRRGVGKTKGMRDAVGRYPEEPNVAGWGKKGKRWVTVHTKFTGFDTELKRKRAGKRGTRGYVRQSAS